MSDLIDQLGYDKYIDPTRELLVSDLWDFEITSYPTAVYNPGDIVFKARVRGISGLSVSEYVSDPLTTEIRGFEVPPQPGQTKLTLKTITIDTLDYEDQSILAWILDYSGKCYDFINQRSSFKASELRSDWVLYRKNSIGQYVRKWDLKAAMLSAASYDDNMEGTRAILGEGSVSLKGILIPRLLNLPG